MRYQSAYKPVIAKVPQIINPKSNLRFYSERMLALVFLQLMQDVWVEFRQQPRVKGYCKWEKAKIDGAIKTINNKYKNIENWDILNVWICEAVDDCNDYLNVLKATRRSEFTQKMPYEEIEEAVLVGIMDGCMQWCEKCSQLSGFKITAHTKAIRENFDEIRKKLPFHKLNEKSEITYAYDADAWGNLAQALADRVVKLLTTKE